MTSRAGDRRPLCEIDRLARVLDVDSPAWAIARCHTTANLLRLHERVNRSRDLFDRLAVMILPDTGDGYAAVTRPRLSRAALFQDRVSGRAGQVAS